MKIHIIGARAANPINSDLIKKYASARFSAEKKILQIDVGNPWEEKATATATATAGQAGQAGQADYLLITHLHLDHVGQIGTVPPTTTIYVPHKSFKTYLAARTSAPISVFAPRRKTYLRPFCVTAFPVQHSAHTKTFGYRLEYKNTAIVWLPDFRALKGCIKYFKSLDILFIGASCFSRSITHRDHHRYGHMAIIKTLRLIRGQRLRPKKIFLMHLGKQLTPLKEKLTIIRKKFPDFDIDVAIDGQNIEFKKPALWAKVRVTPPHF